SRSCSSKTGSWPPSISSEIPSYPGTSPNCSTGCAFFWAPSTPGSRAASTGCVTDSNRDSTPGQAPGATPRAPSSTNRPDGRSTPARQPQLVVPLLHRDGHSRENRPQPHEVGDD